MGALQGFLPFVVFAVVQHAVGTVAGLMGGAAVSIVLLVRGRRRGEREPNLLEAGSALLFGALAVVALLRGGTWSLWFVRAWVDGGLALLVAWGVAVGRPFTLQHSAPLVSADVARSPGFVRNNRIVSGAWAVAFAVLAAIDASMVARPETLASIGIAASAGTLIAAAGFTAWFRARARDAAAARRPSSARGAAGIADMR